MSLLETGDEVLRFPLLAPAICHDDIVNVEKDNDTVVDQDAGFLGNWAEAESSERGCEVSLPEESRFP